MLISRPFAGRPAIWLTEEPEWQQEHLTAWIFGIFASLALVLAAIGLYSVVSYTVAQRTNEFGIRMALGAPRRHVLEIVFASTLVSVCGGIAVGIALSIALNSVLSRWAEGNARDPVILLVGTVLLALVSGVACTIPACHAARVDPTTQFHAASSVDRRRGGTACRALPFNSYLASLDGESASE